MAANWTQEQVIEQLTTASSTWRWAGLTITYAFPSTAAGMNTAFGEATGFRSVNLNQQVYFKLAMQAWDDLIPQSFQQSSGGTSDIEMAY